MQDTAGLRVRGATEEDAGALAALAARCPMAGDITVATVPGPRAAAFRAFVDREVFVAEAGDGVVGSVALDRRTTRCGTSLTSCSYITDLRVAPDVRRTGVATAMAEVVLAAHRRRGSRFITSLTLGGNGAVERFMGKYARRPRKIADTRLIQWILLGRGASGASTRVRAATEADLGGMWKLLDRSWRERSFAPALSLDAFASEWRRDPSFSIEDAMVVERGGDIVGCGALWDQRALKEERVLHYSLPLRAVALGVRAHAALLGGPTLPRTGYPLPLAHVRYFAAADLDSARVIRDGLLARARDHALLIVMLGVDERDPLATIARGRLHVTLRGALWASADADDADFSALVERPASLDYGVA